MVAQAQIRIGGPALQPTPRPQAKFGTALPAAAPARTTETNCDACHDSGEVWLLDRHAGAVWMPCGCGAARDGGTSASWLAIVGYPCAAAGLCASVFFLL